MTGEQETAKWRREDLPRAASGVRFPWLALAGVAATIVAATVLVLGIGDTVSSRDGSAGRLLPLQAASPSAPSSAATPWRPPESIPSDPPPPYTPPTTSPGKPPARSTPPPGRGVDDALLRLRRAVDEGVAAGEVRDDVGLDLGNVIEGILDRRGRSLDRVRADVAGLRHKIATRTREGAIAGGRAEELRLILDGAPV
ncbi:hypothetical protein [Actinomadura sp. WMMA1423]|uniref:hypothetical protein n=1 Tax=Actinomadura sp. WMMA1423 TaxID=2591108 RepID=UPI001146E840|nr:hypothetical protein [Actinomadura sp. WMMA1423]